MLAVEDRKKIISNIEFDTVAKKIVCSEFQNLKRFNKIYLKRQR